MRGVDATYLDQLPTGPLDIKLVACDMDGTLLDGNKRIPDALWPLLEQLRAHGIEFAPASGRQYATLAEQFGQAGEGLDYIAENGAFVVSGGREVSSSPLPDGAAQHIVATLRAHADRGANVGVVLCGKRSAYVERTDAPFMDKVTHYYKALTVVDNLADADDDFLKVAIYDFGGAQGTADALAGVRLDVNVVVSDKHWADVMAVGVDKGKALAALRESLGVTKDQTVVFGDFLNDLEMMSEASLSFAMQNAHPDVAAVAAYRAPANTEHGVIAMLTELVKRVSPYPNA